MRERVAEMWGCAEPCGCLQPRIYERSTVHYNDPNYRPPVLLWEGEWICSPDAEQYAEQVQELKEAAHDLGARLPELYQD